MSRCFPFPPPGYERNTKTGDLDSQKKEKDREKNQKKEKRDKEKKEGKEKREKERSHDKHKEKRDKKEKHRDKKKEKEKDQGKDNHKNAGILSVEKRVVGPSGSHILISSEKGMDRESDKSANLLENRVAGLSVFSNGKHISENKHLAPESKDNSLRPETKHFICASKSGQKNAEKERRIINQVPGRSVVTGSKDSEVAKLEGVTAGPLVDGKERSKENAALDRRMDAQGVVGEAGSGVGAPVPHSVRMAQTRVGLGRPLEKKVGQGVDGKYKIGDKGADDRKGDKQKDKDEMPILKDKNKEKEKKKGEKLKVTSEQKHAQRIDGNENHLLKPSLKDGYKKGISSAQNVELQNIPKDTSAGVLTFNNLGKRKEIGLSGVYDEHTTGPNKLARTMNSSHPLTEIGRSLEPCQNATDIAVHSRQDRTLASDDTDMPSMNIIKVVGKEHRINGLVTPSMKQRPSQMTANAERKCDAVLKAPHPDTKHLKHVLSVPKVDEGFDFDDQGWLFDSSSSQTLKPEVDCSGIDKTPQVWAKALWLEPADVYALPYVIPH